MTVVIQEYMGVETGLKTKRKLRLSFETLSLLLNILMFNVCEAVKILFHFSGSYCAAVLCKCEENTLVTIPILKKGSYTPAAKR